MSTEEFTQLQGRLNRKPPPPDQVDADNSPSKRYAVLVKDGKVIATFYKSGLMVTPNSVRVPDDLSLNGDGTSLADIRIKQMQDMHGGTVEYTQAFNTVSRSKNSETLMTAQILGQNNNSPNKIQMLFETFKSRTQ